MQITGEMLIGASSVRGTEGQQQAFDPRMDQFIATPTFGMGGQAEVDRAAQLAAQAFDPYRQLSLAKRAEFLELIADNIMALGDALIERAMAESGLPLVRLQGERGRTVGQLRLFAKVVRDGRFMSPAIDHAQPERTPLPRADLRLAKMALGPVAVFGASNFPLAFSVAGGDTASALAAGAPVVVKAHSAHLGTSEMVGRAIQKAVRDLGLPEGVFSLLMGAGRKLGEALVAHPAIKAVGFTGSRQGGLALMRIANARPEPIPVYAEMSSINPVFLLPAALAARGDQIARDLIDSLVLGVGQFCTNPGLIVLIDELQPGVATKAVNDRFVAQLREALSGQQPHAMLTRTMRGAFEAGVAHWEEAGAELLLRETAEAGQPPRPVLAQVSATEFIARAALREEVFGPSSLIVRAASLSQALQVLQAVGGSLTVTLWGVEQDGDRSRALVRGAMAIAGRVLFAGVPTGVAVTAAQQHGGPWPSSTRPESTSVGDAALARFLRPVCLQDAPAWLVGSQGRPV